VDLTIKQTQALDYLEDQSTNELLFGGGAGGAKSVLGCYWVLKCSLKYPGTRWVIGRAVLKTLKETTLNTFWWVCSQQGVQPSKHFHYYENKGLIKFPNGSEILLKDLESYPSDPNFDELGSLEITGAFVDECNQIIMKAWDVLKSRIRYRLDEYNLVPKILGTCNPAKNWVFSRFYSPSVAGTLQDNRKFVQSLLLDNPHISRHYKENLLTLDNNSKQRLLYGNWNYDDDPSVLCDYDAITDLFTNDHVKPEGASYISADLAMKGRDRFVAGLWKGLVCEIRIDKSLSGGKEIEQDIKNLMLTGAVGHSQTVVDSDGLGAYLESYLTGIKEFHGGARAIDDKEYANLKSECGYKLAELINKRQIKVVCKPEQAERIKEELGVLKADDIDADEKKKRIIKKDAMKEHLGRSPDYLDMLLMRMLFIIKPQRVGSISVPRL
jgi:phage terminase large subunit